MSRGRIQRYRLGLLAAVLYWSATQSSHARQDILDQPVTLATESDLVQAVSTTLQHALVTTEQFQARTPRLRRFARQELESRRKGLKVLSKRAGIQPPSITKLAIEPNNERQYIQAMLRNHARLLELIEHGMGLPMSPDIKRMMNKLSASAMNEFSALSAMASSRKLALEAGTVSREHTS